MAASSSVAADPLDAYRDRFQQGLNRYRAGDVHGAVQYWEAIRRELGDEVAYRLLYNLGKAYETLGDATVAVERYETFLQQLERQEPADINDVVRENGVRAQAQIADLNKSRGRIRILPSERAGLVQVDQGRSRLGPFRAYVAPGKHTVTIDRGTTIERVIAVSLDAGEEVVVDPTRSKPVRPPASTTSAPVASSPAMLPPPVVSPRIVTKQRPFPSYVLYVSAGATVASLAVPWLAYRNASGLSDEYEDAATTVSRRRELADRYDSARTMYGVSWLVPAVFAGATGALSVWFIQGGERSSDQKNELGAGVFPGGMQLRGEF